MKEDSKTETLQFKVTEHERKLIEKCAQEEGNDRLQVCARRSSHEHGDGWQGRSNQDRGARGRRKGIWRRPTETCQTDTGRTLTTVLSVTPSQGEAGPRRMPAGCGRGAEWPPSW
jgi:hypothetical protein